MAEITTSGIQAAGLTGMVTRLETAFRAALGQDLALASETPQGQLIGDIGEVFAEVEELATYVANGLSLHNAQKRQLDDWGTFVDLPKIDGEKSTVTATLTGTPGTIIPARSRARTAAGAVFLITATATIPASGTVDVLMRATENGPLVAAAGTLTQIVDARAGWTGVTNAQAARLGRLVESDAEYRRRYGKEVATHAVDDLEAIRARVRSEDGVTDALVRDNDTATAKIVQGLSIPPGNILVVAQGGADQDIARAIALTKPAGAPTVGTHTIPWLHPQGFSVDINFRRVDPIPIAVTAPLTALPGFPSNGLATMRQNLLQWFTGMWPLPGPGIFDQTGVGIGEYIDLERITTPLNAVPGHVLGRVVIRRKPGLVTGIAVTDGGRGYTSAPAVAIAGGSGATAVAIVRNGAVVRVDITDRGDGSLSAAPAISFTGGGGNGAAATGTISTANLGVPNLDQQYTLASEDISLSLTLAPLLVTAAVSGATLELTYNLPLNVASVPAADDFEITVAGVERGVSAVAIADNKVTLTLASAVTAGQVVTVSYTPGVNVIQDPAGNRVAALMNEPVINR